MKFRHKGLKNADELDILFKDVAATGEGAWAPSTNFVPNDGEDRSYRSYNALISEVDRMHVVDVDFWIGSVNNNILIKTNK